MPELSLGLVLLVASASIFAPLSGWLASQRRRNPVLWGLFGVVLGPVAPGLLLTAPPGRCAACSWPVAGWRERCARCGADVRSGASGRSSQAFPHGLALAESVPAKPAGAPPARRRTAAAQPPSNGRRSGRRPAADAGTNAPVAPARRRTRGSAGAEITNAAGSAPFEPSPAPAWAPRVQATGLGHRPEAAASPPTSATAPALSPVPDPAPAAEAAIQIIGSGVYMGGNRPIETGSRYLLARVGDELQVLGPVHLNAGQVADRLPVADLDVFVLEDRLLIGGRSGRDDATMAFVAVSLERGVDLEAMFGPPASATRTAAG